MKSVNRTERTSARARNPRAVTLNLAPTPKHWEQQDNGLRPPDPGKCTTIPWGSCSCWWHSREGRIPKNLQPSFVLFGLLKCDFSLKAHQGDFYTSLSWSCIPSPSASTSLTAPHSLTLTPGWATQGHSTQMQNPNKVRRYTHPSKQNSAFFRFSEVSRSLAVRGHCHCRSH